jgi:hypothetical protein
MPDEAQNHFFSKQKVIESQTIKNFSAGGEKIEKRQKVLQRYTEPRESTKALYKASQHIVVYLKSRRRRREKANVLRRYTDTSPRIRALSLVRAECTTALHRHVPKNPGS